MDLSSLAEMLDRLDQMIASFEQDENRFYVIIDLAYQMRDELRQTIALDPDE
jgi:hypothetical protein